MQNRRVKVATGSEARLNQVPRCVGRISREPRRTEGSRQVSTEKTVPRAPAVGPPWLCDLTGGGWVTLLQGLSPDGIFRAFPQGSTRSPSARGAGTLGSSM